MLERLSRAWLWPAIFLLILVGGSSVLFRRDASITNVFFVTQDLPVLEAITLVLAVLLGSRRLRAEATTVMTILAAVVRRAARRPPSTVMVASLLALLSGLIAFVGVRVVFDGYPLSMDEFMAAFDAVIFGHGQVMAPIALQFRPLAPAFVSSFMLPTRGYAFWVSSYLPVNAGLRALAGAAGGADLLNPMLAALSVVTTFAIARRLWPGRADLALIAATLLATSSQFLITAMTPYAMTAHLALNLVWLWLFLRGGFLGHAGAILVGFLACGLHQLIFHPLFAAPFVLQLWLERRWRLGIVYTIAYATICLFWSLYWPLALSIAGAAPRFGSDLGTPWLVSRVAALVVAFKIAKIGVMAKNLIRFITWQGPLTVPLVLLSFVAALRSGGPLRCLALGLALTTTAMFALLAYQGHGWGYRYLHGLLGSACLLAAFGWGRLTDGLSPPGKATAKAALVTVAVASLAVLFPFRAWQAHRFARPYAAAEAAIEHANTQVVLVNYSGVWFGSDLIRNDPYLRNRPIVMNLGSFDAANIHDLCSRYTVSVFDRANARSFGIRTFNAHPEEPDLAAQLRDGCPTPFATIKPPRP